MQNRQTLSKNFTSCNHCTLVQIKKSPKSKLQHVDEIGGGGVLGVGGEVGQDADRNVPSGHFRFEPGRPLPETVPVVAMVMVGEGIGDVGEQ